MSARVAMAAARGILLTCNRSMLAEYGGHVELNTVPTSGNLTHACDTRAKCM